MLLAIAQVLALAAAQLPVECPSGATSPEGSTSASSCVCAAGYSGDARAGESCEPCGAGRFKPYEGAGECMACPDGGESADEGRSCATCPLGTYLEDNVPRLSCIEKASGSSGYYWQYQACPCWSSVGTSSGTITPTFPGTFSDMYPGLNSCSWVISAFEPSINLSLSLPSSEAYRPYVEVHECETANCSRATRLALYYPGYPGSFDPSSALETVQTFTSSTSHLRLRVSDPGPRTSIRASWSTGAQLPPACVPCPADTCNTLEWDVPWHDGPEVMWLEDSPGRVVRFFQLRSSFTGAPTLDVSFLDGDQMFGPDLFAEILPLGQGDNQYAETTLQAEPDSFGHSVWTVTVTDQRGGETITQEKSLHITVLPVNDAPSYEAAEHSFFTSQDQGSIKESHWARNITAGPSNENDQQLSFQIFQVTGPRGIAMAHISSDGTLVFDLSDKLGYAGSGNTSWEVILMDDGGQLHGGVDKSEPRHIRLEVFKRPALPKFLSLKQIETLRLSLEGSGHQGGQGVVSPPGHELLPSWPASKFFDPQRASSLRS